MPRYILDTCLGEGACNALQDAVPFAAFLHARPSGCPCLLQIGAAPGYSQHMCCAEPRLSLVQEAYAGGLQHNHLRCTQWVLDISGLVESIAEVVTRDAECFLPQGSACRHIRTLHTGCLAPDWHADGPIAA
jgi:hypothetical protein